jgi:hypothetical protein
MGAIDRLLKVIDGRARMLGLDAPTRHRHNITFGSPVEELGIDEDEVRRLRDLWVDSFGPSVDGGEPQALMAGPTSTAAGSDSG